MNRGKIGVAPRAWRKPGNGVQPICQKAALDAISHIDGDRKMAGPVVGPHFGPECRLASGSPAVILAAKDLVRELLGDGAFPDERRKVERLLEESLNLAQIVGCLNRAVIALELLRARHPKAPEWIGIGALAVHDARNALCGYVTSPRFPAASTWRPDDVLAQYTIAGELHEYLRPAGSEPLDDAVCLRCGRQFAAAAALAA